MTTVPTDTPDGGEATPIHSWVVYYLATGSHSIEVEARTAEEAREKADDAYADNAPPSLCHQCARIDLSDWEQDDRADGVDDLGPVG